VRQTDVSAGRAVDRGAAPTFDSKKMPAFEILLFTGEGKS
jgi:hypothetical protein